MNLKIQAPSKPEKVEVLAYLKDGSLWPHEGEFAAELLRKYRRLIARGGLQGWQIIEEMLGDDWGAPPKYMQILVDDKEVARIPYDKPKESRR